METQLRHEKNADQIAYWNGPTGQRWTDRQTVQDILLAPALQILIDRAQPKVGERILDVGCGCGATTIALAERVAPAGFVRGIDISEPMLARARQRAPTSLPLSFVLADATVYPFDPQDFDLLVSRFGVMFFAEPAVSFANLRRAMRPEGRVTFVCWRDRRSINTCQSCRSRGLRIPVRLPSPPTSACAASCLRPVIGTSRWSAAISRSTSPTAAGLRAPSKQP